MTVKVVKPIKITEAVLTASTIPEPDASVGEVEWVEDRFNGYVFSNNVTEKQAFDAVEMGGFIYVVEGKENAVGQGLAYLHKYQTDGTHVWSEQIDNSVDAFVSIGHLADTLILIESGDANVITFNVSTRTQSLSPLSPIPDLVTGIAFDGFKYYILDAQSGLVKRYNTDFTYDNFEIDPKLGKFGLVSLKYKDGNLSVVDQKTGNITTFSIDGSLVSSFSYQTAFQSNLDCLGHFYLNDNIYVIDNSNSNAYKFTDGIYQGYYQPSERAILTSTHKLYQCVKATSIRPDLGATGDESETWVEVSPTNRWSQFVDTITSYTESLIPYSFDLKPNEKFTAVAFFGCSGIQTIIVRVKNSGGTTIETRTLQMIDSDAELEWGLDPNSPAFIDQEFIDGLPWAAGYYLNITVNPKSGFASKMKLVTFGIDRLIGEAVNESMKKNYIDLSTYENDQFGNTRITKRPVVGLNTYSALVDGVRIDVVDRFLNSLAGEFNIWLADIGAGQKMLTYGAYERAPTEIDSNTYRNYIATIRSAI